MVEHPSLVVERDVLQRLRQIRALDPQDTVGLSRFIQEIVELASGLRGASLLHQPPHSIPVPADTKFSYTQLQTYRTCPMKYQYSYIYKIPVPPTPQMVFGMDLHTCLEDFFRRRIKGETLFLEDLLAHFRRLAVPGRYGDRLQDQEYRRWGEELLTAFYQVHGGTFPTPLFVEKAFSLRLGDAWIRGVVDRIDPLQGGGVEIIDYKSGKPKEEADSDEQLQLRLYAIASKEVFGLQPKRVSFYYLRNNQKLSFEQKDDTLEATKGQIRELIDEIRSGDFSPRPSVMKCRWCDFKNLCPASVV